MGNGDDRSRSAFAVPVGELPAEGESYGDLGGVQYGVWEHLPGTSTDVEADEVFVVLTGRGTVRFESGEVLDLAPGVVARLHAGERTTWEITEPLRKVYAVTRD
ncbi:MAG: cupin domain-containing protein [Nocardioidaceae bacterium]